LRNETILSRQGGVSSREREFSSHRDARSLFWIRLDRITDFLRTSLVRRSDERDAPIAQQYCAFDTAYQTRSIKRIQTMTNDSRPIRESVPDGIARGSLAPRRLQIGRDLRTIYGTGADSDSRASGELKIVTGFLQRSVHFRSRYVRTFKRVQIRSCIESALS